MCGPADQTELFHVDEPVPRPAPAEDTRTNGQKIRDRQAARIAAGLHPLANAWVHIRLHPDAVRDPADRTTGPRCGGCRHRQLVGGHARDYPKCMVGYAERPIPPEQQVRGGPTKHITWPPRATMSDTSDVRAWWPACGDYQPKTTTGER